MKREELKGKQTPGKWEITDTETATGHRKVSSQFQYGKLVAWVGNAERTKHAEFAANAALIAEAGTVANRTGMWPEDMEERIKELEKGLEVALGDLQQAQDETHIDFRASIDIVSALLNK